jgi:hypothetical protein
MHNSSGSTWSLLAPQLPLLTVHCNIVGILPFPAVTPVTVVVGETGLVITPGPLRILHVPVPVTTGVAASENVDVEHCSWSVPATATSGAALCVNITSSKLSLHTPLLIVQRSVTLDPAVSPVTVLTGSDGLPITAPLAAP